MQAILLALSRSSVLPMLFIEFTITIIMKYLLVALLALLLTLGSTCTNCNAEKLNVRCCCFIYYVIPEKISSNISQCARFEYHNDSFNCSTTTFNELFYHFNNISTSEGDIKQLLLVFLPGMHLVNNRQSQWLLAQPLNLTIIGKGNVTSLVIINYLISQCRTFSTYQ